MTPDAPRPGALRRAGRAWLAFEESLETSVMPWAILTAIVALAAIAMMVSARLGLGGDPFNDRAFDAGLWRSSDGEQFDCPRGEMLANLEAQHLRVGAPREQMLALLGPPDATGQDGLASWYLGYWSGFRVDMDSLDLQFDGDGRLVRWQRAQH